MKTIDVPTIPVTSAKDLMDHFHGNTDLPTTDAEALAVIKQAPEEWRGKTILFPCLVTSAQTEGQGDVVVAAHITGFVWNSVGQEWQDKHYLAGREGWGRVGPDHIRGEVVIPHRL